MCGRYRRTTAEEGLARRYHIPIPAQLDLPISWNLAPSQDVLAIRFNPKTKQRSLDPLRWGLIPYWAKDPKIAYKTINARAESVDTAPSYQQAFKKRRCLIPVDTFYEWKKVGWREDSVRNRHEGRFSVRFRRPVGRLERSCHRRMAAHLYDYHGRGE
jgi:putative SOS response-associated peptidase YedK